VIERLYRKFPNIRGYEEAEAYYRAGWYIGLQTSFILPQGAFKYFPPFSLSKGRKGGGRGDCDSYTVIFSGNIGSCMTRFRLGPKNMFIII
jgi:hypothetical protein